MSKLTGIASMLALVLVTAGCGDGTLEIKSKSSGGGPTVIEKPVIVHDQPVVVREQPAASKETTKSTTTTPDGTTTRTKETKTVN